MATKKTAAKKTTARKTKLTLETKAPGKDYGTNKDGTPAKRRGRKPGNTGRQKTEMLYGVVLEGILCGRTTAQIALDMGYSAHYIKQLRQHDKFKEMFDDAIRARREAINNRLEHLAETALDVHLEVMDDKAHRHRLQAAEGILDRIGATQKGSFVKQQVTQVVDNFSGRSQEDLEYYVEHGCFPEEAPE